MSGVYRCVQIRLAQLTLILLSLSVCFRPQSDESMHNDYCFERREAHAPKVPTARKTDQPVNRAQRKIYCPAFSLAWPYASMHSCSQRRRRMRDGMVSWNPRVRAWRTNSWRILKPSERADLCLDAPRGWCVSTGRTLMLSLWSRALPIL